MEFPVFQPVPTDSSHCMPLRVWLCLLTQLHHIFVHIDWIPLRLLHAEQVHLFCLIKCSCSFNTSLAHLWIRSGVSWSPLCWEAQTQTQHSWCVLLGLSRWEGPLPWAYWWYFAIYRLLAHFAETVHCCVMAIFLPNRTSKSFIARWPLRWHNPSPGAGLCIFFCWTYESLSAHFLSLSRSFWMVHRHLVCQSSSPFCIIWKLIEVTLCPHYAHH